MDRDAHKTLAEISGGMHRRAGIAGALALDPPIHLIDEPTLGADPITVEEIDVSFVRLP
jgi:phospholipid/cholesterol/gamma-HCH transport system ATP-binding protein